MPSRKRRVIPDEEQEDDETSAVKEEQEEAEEPSRRRRRHSSPPAARNDADSTGDGEEEEEAMDDEDSYEEDAGELPASPRKRINRPGQAAEAGIVKTIHLENFMCHRKLTVNFNRNVNFIHGQNGSGKSAILAALQICLGAGARRTHRARNLKELIRKDSSGDTAKVRVTLWNQGGDAFQPHLYGDFLTVERCITKGSGYNGYKLLDSTGKEVSRKKKDLELMLDHLNIQVENPVAILDQEEAKKFLTGKASDKYAFFSKATELDRLDRRYAGIKDKLSETEVTKEKVQSSVQVDYEKVAVLKKEVDKFHALERWEDKKQDLQVQLAWAIYHNFDEKYQEALEKKDKVLHKKEKRLAELKSIEEASADTSTETEIAGLLEQLSNEANVGAEQERALKTELKHAEAPIHALKRQLHNEKRQERSQQQNLNEAQSRLDDERRRILENNKESVEAQRALQIQKAESSLQQVQDEIQQARQQRTQHQQAYESAEPHRDQASRELSSLKSQSGAVSNKIRTLQSSSNSTMELMGQRCSTLFKMVQQFTQKGKWRGPVLGPLGAYIKIAPGKEKYAEVAELALGGGMLDRFLVTCDHDRTLMQQLRDKARCSARECGILQLSVDARYRIQPPPADGIETVATVLQVSEDLVFNALVDFARIDIRAIGDSKQSTEELLLVRNGNGSNSIRGGKIKEVYFLPRGDNWKLSKSGNFQMTSNERRLKRTIGVDKTGALAEAKRELGALKTEIQAAQAKYDGLNKDCSTHQKQWNTIKRKMNQQNQRRESLEKEIEELKLEAESAAAADASDDTSGLEEDVDEARRSLEEVRERIRSIEEETERKLPEIEDVQKRLDEIMARNEKVALEVDAADKKLSEVVNEKAHRESGLAKARDKLAKAEEMLIQSHQAIDERKEQRDKFMVDARSLQYRRDASRKFKEEAEENTDGEDVPSPSVEMSLTAEIPEGELEKIQPPPRSKSVETYEAKVRKMEEKIAREKARQDLEEMDPNVAYEKWRRAQTALDQRLKKLDVIRENVDSLVRDLKARRKLWFQFQKYLSEMTNFGFDEMLNTKGSSGSLKFDHEEHTLDLVVQKDSKDEASQTADVKALSGGERSFTTIALLLSLGERLETPFRVMDEFDVFLDPVARRLALKTLIDLAKRLNHRQFIFITPQDLSGLTPDDKLKIHKLKAPARNAAASNLTQQTLD